MARPMLFTTGMRGVLIVVLIVAFGYVFMKQKQGEKVTKAAQPVAVSTLTPAPRGQASEYNYAKRSIDRARDVRDLARTQTQDAQDPH